MVHLQTEIASRRGGDPGFKRLIWLPDGLTTEDDRQRKFIDYVRSDPAIQKSAEFLEGSLEKLKEAGRERIDEDSQSGAGGDDREGTRAAANLSDPRQSGHRCGGADQRVFVQRGLRTDPIVDGRR